MRSEAYTRSSRKISHKERESEERKGEKESRESKSASQHKEARESHLFQLSHDVLHGRATKHGALVGENQLGYV